ncbi:PAQR family membrane homeostasis protein TrhA [Devriesea agamarum]|uniref:PAQR family membrane homeostasis protein TrhA n=1 Tax=Devriesea agamarum TaxID=472569 RepID=UPI000A029322|nr:hemolysin III family protein [Devriesea agamarum]
MTSHSTPGHSPVGRGTAAPLEAPPAKDTAHTGTDNTIVRGLHEAAAAAKPRLRGWIHLFTFPTSIIAGTLLIAFGPTLASRLACAVFVVTAGMLFGISATYHRGTWSQRGAIILRRFDHANIFLIIAGTYTPLAVTLLSHTQATILLFICWGGAALGVIFRLFWTSAPRWLYVPAYVALGWVAIFYMPQMLHTGGWAVVSLLVAGGLLYTVGAVVYGLKRPNPSPYWFGFHEIFHAFTVTAFVCHFIAVWLAVATV